MAEDDALGGAGGSAGEEDRRPVRRGCRNRIGRGVRHIVHREDRDGKTGKAFARFFRGILSFFRGLPLPDLCAGIFAACAMGLVWLPEVIYIRDIYEGEYYRANTMFKLSYQAFILFGMVMGYVLVRAIALQRRNTRRRQGFGRLASAAPVLGILLLLFTGGYVFNAAECWIAPFGEMLNRQYYHDLPAVVEKCAPGMLYTPTSPWSPEGSKNTDPSLADVHYWIPWTKRGQTATFETYRSRFFSEYGFQSFAGIETVRQFAPDSVHWDVNSEMMMFHQRGGSFANGRMMGEMEDNYRVPRAFVDQLYLSQLVQGDVIRGAIEAHRRDKPFCWGTLVWQINDCWPVASWAGRDWYGTWKAQHYFCKYAFQDILPSTSLLDDKVGIWLVSDRLQPVSGKLEICFETFDGQVVLKQEKKVRLAANSSMKIQDFYTRELGAEPSALFVRLNFTDSKGVSYSNRRLLTSVKNAQLPACRITSSVKPVAGGYEVTVFSDRYARGVWLNVENGILRCDADGKALPGTCTASNFSDNFFDLAAGENRTVFIASELPYERFVNSLLIRDFVSATR